MAVEKRSYTIRANNKDVAGVICNACDSLATEYDGTYCIVDLIMDVADGFCPDTYGDDYKHLIDAVADIESSIGEVIREGMIDTSDRQFSFAKLLQLGYYEYLTEALYDNVETIVFNHLADKWNERGEHTNTEDIMMEKAINDISSEDDMNKSFDYYEDKLNKAIELMNLEEEED